jgi:hypothetical protein
MPPAAKLVLLAAMTMPKARKHYVAQFLGMMVIMSYIGLVNLKVV